MTLKSFIMSASLRIANNSTSSAVSLNSRERRPTPEPEEPELPESGSKAPEQQENNIVSEAKAVDNTVATSADKATMNSKTKNNLSHLQEIAVLFQPLKWVDILTSTQRKMFHHVTHPKYFCRVCALLEEDLNIVPVLSFFFDISDKEPFDDFTFVSVGTYCGRVVVFDFGEIWDNGHFYHREDMLPRKIQDWLESPSIIVLISNLSDSVYERWFPFYFRCGTVVDTAEMFLIHQTCGFIRPRKKSPTGDSKSQLSLSINYHHCKSSKQELIDTLGKYNYCYCPDIRQNSWWPRPGPFLDSETAFWLFFETNCPHIFVNYIIQQSIMRGGIISFISNENLSKMYMSFMEEYLKTKESLPQRKIK